MPSHLSHRERHLEYYSGYQTTVPDWQGTMLLPMCYPWTFCNSKLAFLRVDKNLILLLSGTLYKQKHLHCVSIQAPYSFHSISDLYCNCQDRNIFSDEKN